MAISAKRSALLAVIATALLVGGSAKTNIIPSFAGPYLLYVDKFYPCLLNGRPPETPFAFRHVTRFNPSRPFQREVLSGFVNATRRLDDTWWGGADIAIRTNNQWKEHAFIFKFPNVGGCSTFRDNIPDLFHILFKDLGLDADRKKPCVIPVGHYRFDREPVAWVFPNFPIFPYGHYRIKFAGGPQGDSAGVICVAAETHVIPKPR